MSRLLFGLTMILAAQVGFAQEAVPEGWGGPASGSVQIVVAVLALIGTCFMGWITYLIAKLNTSQNRAAAAQTEVAARVVQVAVNTEEVRATLQANTAVSRKEMAGLKEVADKTHEAVNGSMGIQLKLNWTMAARLAKLTDDPVDIEAASLAEAAYKAHEENSTKKHASPENGE